MLDSLTCNPCPQTLTGKPVYRNGLWVILTLSELVNCCNKFCWGVTQQDDQTYRYGKVVRTLNSIDIDYECQVIIAIRDLKNLHISGVLALALLQNIGLAAI